MTPLLRRYEDAELGADGYPGAWHRCPACSGAGCVECFSGGSIKNMIRALNGGRCERCRHPYRPGEHGRGEWSRCDETCRHGGPVRALTPDEDGNLDPWESTDDLAAGAVVALIASSLDPIEARWRILTVHHLTGDKADCRWWNLAALCQRCHLSIQGRVRMEQTFPLEHSPWFRPHAAGYYAWTYLGDELGRDEAIARLDELLALEAAGL